MPYKIYDDVVFAQNQLRNRPKPTPYTCLRPITPINSLTEFFRKTGRDYQPNLKIPNMKHQHLFLCSALLGMLFLRSCREVNDGLYSEASAASAVPAYSSFDGGPQNPPKDKPKDKPRDYDDWRPTERSQ